MTGGPAAGEPAQSDEALAQPEAEVRPRQQKGTVVVTTVASDAHTWNLVFLQLLLNELGYHVINLGPCVPDDVLVQECLAIRPDLLVVSTVNGHGFQDGMRVIGRLREHGQLAATPAVIGGKLGVTDDDAEGHGRELMAAGFDAVFADGADPVSAFRNFIAVFEGSAAGTGDQPLSEPRSTPPPRITA